MTCVVGIVQDGVVTIAGDSAGCAGWDLSVRADAKVWATGGWAFGFTSSFRMGQLLRWSFTPPALIRGVDLERYMATTFVDAVRKCLKAGGYARRDLEEEKAGTFLVGRAGRLFRVESDYQVAEQAAPYDAVGCGAPYALGALAVLVRTDETARAMAEISLDVAERHSAGVRGPFLVVDTGADQAV